MEEKGGGEGKGGGRDWRGRVEEEGGRGGCFHEQMLIPTTL